MIDEQMLRWRREVNGELDELRTLDRVEAMPVFNVRARGAHGDGSTDDSAALASTVAALNNAGGGVMVLPPGTYNFSSGFTIEKFIILQGSGTNSLLNYTGSGAAITVDGSGTATSVLRDFKLKGPGSGTAGSIGIDVQRHSVTGDAAWNILFSSLNINGFEYGIQTDRLFSSLFENLYIRDATVNLTNGGTALTFLNTFFVRIPSGAYGLRTDSQGRLNVIGCNFDSKDTGGDGLIVRNVHPLTILGCNFEDMYSSGSSGSPDRIAITLGDSTPAFWGSGSIQDCSFVDLGTAIKVQRPSIAAESEMSLRALRFNNVSTIIDEGSVTKNESRIVCLDRSVTLDDATNVSETVFEAHPPDSQELDTVFAPASDVSAIVCWQISGFSAGKGYPQVEKCAANDTSKLKVVAANIRSNLSFNLPSQFRTRGLLNTGKDQSTWTIGATAYLQDDGTIGNAAGTNTVKVGYIVDQDNPGNIWFMPPDA